MPLKRKFEISVKQQKKKTEKLLSLLWNIIIPVKIILFNILQLKIYEYANTVNNKRRVIHNIIPLQ